MNNEIIIDKINIKDLPEMLSLYFREKGIKKYNNLRAFYTRLLEEISEEIKNSYLNRILKYMSSSDAITINIFDDFCEGIYDDELKIFCKKLTENINMFHDYSELYEALNRQIIFLFYEEQKFYEIKKLNNEKKYDEFIFELLKHAFSNYKTSLPKIVSKRFFGEAITLPFNSNQRASMLKLSADLGYSFAGKLYGDIIRESNINEAVGYYLKCKEEQSALWIIGRSLELNLLNRETINLIKQELNYCFINDNFTSKLSFYNNVDGTYNEETLILAFKLYKYMADNYHFSKAINSVGKLMIFNFIVYNDDKVETIKIGKKYLKEAIKLGNINSMVNLAFYLDENHIDDEYDSKLVKKMFEAAAKVGDVVANHQLAKILYNENKISEAIEYYNYSAMKGYRYSYHELGKIYETLNDDDKAIESYRNAISHNHINSVYNLAFIYYSKSLSNSKYIVLLREIIERYRDRLDDKTKEKCMNLLKNIENEK